MPLLVSDTSPLNLLIRVGRVDVLPALFGRVVVPGEVAAEMAHPKAPKIVREFIADLPGWSRIQSPAAPMTFPTPDAGESAAIALALELNSPLMIDERDGRDIARAHGIAVIGAIGILERAADMDLIADLASVYAEIRTMRFHISDALLDESLERHHRKRSPE